MRRWFVLVIFFLSLPFALAETNNWHIVKSTHFIIYYKNAQDNFVEEVIDKAEDYYNKIADNLGFRRYNFWLWENRAKIYIYDDALDYQSATGQPNWSKGCAMAKDKIIHTFPNATGFFDTILPHEMGHIIFREFVGFDNNAVPLWLDEGVASYQENLRKLMANRIVKEAIEEDKFMDLQNLSNFNPQLIKDDTELVNLFYAEATSLVNYLIKEFGSDNFVFFCQGLRDKRDLAKAIEYAYPFRNIQDLDRAWQEYLSEATTYGTK